jgi:16S rRNA (adenine1518-N6/adenine1519-N6)-dimethyltransferase
MAIIAPKKSLGQNFLHDQNIARKIAAALDINENDVVIEIGPGTGNLTRFLLEYDAPVYAVEIDKRAIAVLEDEFSDENLNIIHKDILDFDLKDFAESEKRNIKIVGNLPYYISSQILFYIFENAELVEKAIFMLQKEVARRICSKPRTKDYGILTVATELSSSPGILFDVSPKCFYPEPKVWSSIIEFDLSEQIVSRDKYKKTMELVRTAFNQRRKTMKNSLKKYIEKNTHLTLNQYVADADEGLAKIFTQRPEELSAKEFVDLHTTLEQSFNESY